MPDVTGRLVPERKPFEDRALRVPLKDAEAGVDAWLLLGVSNNQLTARFMGEIGNSSNYALHYTVREMVQGLLNAHAFVHGEVFDVDIVGIIRNRADGSPCFYYQDNVHDVIAGRQCRVRVQDIWDLMQFKDGLYVRRALSDFRMALMYHNDTPFYCYRTLEVIRHHIGCICEIKNREEQWTRTWEVLGKSRDEIKELETFATALRHGEPIAYSGEKWQKVVSVTWEIVEGYISFALDIMRASKE